MLCVRCVFLDLHSAGTLKANYLKTNDVKERLRVGTCLCGVSLKLITIYSLKQKSQLLFNF